MPMAAAGGAPAPAGAGMANTAVPTAEGAELTWVAPASWKTKPASAMRKASYTLSGVGGEAELSVTAFPGDVGGELANVNRWRGQVQLPPLAESELDRAIQRVETNDLHIGIVDVVGTGANAQRILGAFVPHNGATWFFKLTGADAVVTAVKPEFLAFVQTIKPAGPTTR